MTADELIALWQGLAVMLLGSLFIVAAVVRWLDSPDCDPSCGTCKVYRHAKRQYARCPMCLKPHSPSERCP